MYKVICKITAINVSLGALAAIWEAAEADAAKEKKKNLLKQKREMQLINTER